ncbi:MAG: hypothetical protein K6F52_02265 [Clostridia bacterium]|nr:hypothetical protein [Clostridia bacterium]
MIFEEIPENHAQFEKLYRTIMNSSVSHAYIFEGESGLDKKLIADCFIKMVLCREKPGRGCDECPVCRKINHGNYEDIIYVRADENSLKDSFIEELQARLMMKPFEGERNIAVIEDADLMTDRAQNRLLKTLEEPPVGTVIILLSENIENLMQTIVSRCVVYHFNSFGEERYLSRQALAERVAEMLLDSMPFYALKSELEETMQDKKEIYMFLDALEHYYRDLLVQQTEKSRLYRRETIFAAVAAVENAGKDLRRGMNPSYALKNLIIELEDIN